MGVIYAKTGFSQNTDSPILNLLELLGVITGIVNVWLTARANVWCWPVGIVNVVVYFTVFFEAKLYADMSLQAVYLALTCYGWHTWLRGGKQHAERKISSAPKREMLAASVFGVISWGVMWYVLHAFTDGSVPWADSFLTAASLIATWLMARKYIENWTLWIVADTLYVGMFLYKNLTITAILYAVFTALAVYGLRTWKMENGEQFSR